MVHYAHIQHISSVDWIQNKAACCCRDAHFAHVWKLPVVEAKNHVDKNLQFLSEDERQRYAAFLQTADKNRYFSGRYWLKRILSEYLHCDYRNINILNDNKGKPAIVPCDSQPYSLCFNISHAGQYVMLAISSFEIGIDVEIVQDNFDFSDIIRFHFTPEERAYILEGSKPVERFFCLWTRKESILKADGCGLIDDLQQITVLNGKQSLPMQICHAPQSVQTFGFDEYIVSVSFDQRLENPVSYTMPACSSENSLFEAKEKIRHINL